MTLCQYYDSYALEQGHKCWNTYCSTLTETHRKYMKKQLKKEYKELYK